MLMCVSPSFVWFTSGPDNVQIPVPCKRCWRCVSNRINDYVGRALAEASVSDWTCTLTLTYAPRDDGADKVITPEHFQAFVRSLRRRGHSLRYFVAGEYGELKGRAHFHAILFGRGAQPSWPQKERFHIASWPHGHVFCDWGADHSSLRYAMKYLNKDLAKETWFSLSKKPPLGADWFAQKAALTVEIGALPSSFEYTPPGARKGTPYLMSGATKRDFILAVCRGWAERRPLDRSMLSEWVFKALEKYELAEAIKAAKWPPVEEYIATLSEQLDKRRVRGDILARMALDEQLAEIQFDQWVNNGHQLQKTPKKGSAPATASLDLDTSQGAVERRKAWHANKRAPRRHNFAGIHARSEPD